MAKADRSSDPARKTFGSLRHLCDRPAEEHAIRITVPGKSWDTTLSDWLEGPSDSGIGA